MKKEKKYAKPPCIFKVDISQEKYELFFKSCKKTDIKEMLYLYFDTDSSPEEARLYSSNVRLRVRLKTGKYSLELKNKTVRPSQDLYQPISLVELNSVLQGVIPKGVIKSKLLGLGLFNGVMLVGSAHTIRAKKLFMSGVLVLDKTINAGQENYQIEFRSHRLISNGELQSVKNKLGISDRCLFPNKQKRIWAIKA